MTEYTDTQTSDTQTADGVATTTTTYLRTYCDTEVHVDMENYIFGMWIWPVYYRTKAQIDALITYCVDYGISKLWASAIDNWTSPYMCMGNSTLCNITTERADGKYPFTYLLEQAAIYDIEVYAWWVIYPWFNWGGATSLLITPLTDNATNHDTDSGGSTLNFKEAVPRGVVEDVIDDFVTENPGLTGVILDYIRTDGKVTDIIDADVTAFVSEMRAKIPAVELAVAALSVPSTSHHQDVPTWLTNDYIDTVFTMAYSFCYGTKKTYLDLCDFTGKMLIIGQQAGSDQTNVSDFRAGLIRYRDLGYRNFGFFNSYYMDANYGAALNALRFKTIDAITVQEGISKINVTPGGGSPSFSITMNGDIHTTLYSDVVAYTTGEALKAYVESIEGERPDIFYQRPTTSTVKIVVGDWEP